MHGMSAPPHCDVDIASAEETRAGNRLDNRGVAPMQR